VTAFGTEQWHEISPYLDHALSLSEPERVLWLKDFRLQHAELADLVEQLLDEHRALSQERFLEDQPPKPSDEEAFIGEAVGPYKLISRIGEGGMGSVWLAERADGRFERQVAIKFLRFAVASQAVDERFQREGRILGQLRHPHIAELLDAGLTAKREPYLVLEYIKGAQIDAYCDERKLGMEKRIELFLDVLDAVAHAHASLVVHRDIKPSNVLVSGEGEVKLLDFGIAKLLADDTNPAVATMLTLEGGAAMTPLFAAPEQITGGPITTATDVYGLGALLFLLLTGQHPAGPGPHSPADLVKSITEIDTPFASQAVALRKDSASAGSRSTTPEKLNRDLKGDVDTILAKALKKKPAERYASVAAFRDDLRRYLQHEPITALPDAVSYRMRKYVRRHRVGVSVSTAFVLLLAGFSVIQSIELRRIIRERDRADAITQFITNMFKMSDPSQARGNSITVREVLDKGSAEIGRGFTNDAETQAGLMNVLGNVYFDLGLYARAETLFSQSLDIRRRVLGPAHPDTLVSMSSLGRTLSSEGRIPEAGRLLRDTLAMQQRAPGPEHPDTLTTSQRLANVLLREGDIAGAEKLTRQVLESRRRVLGAESVDTLQSMDNLAFFLLLEKRYPDAEKVQRDALNVEERVQGPENPDTLDSTNRLARILSLEGRYAEAEQFQRNALDLERRVLGPEHTFTLRSMNNLVDILASEKHYPEAETLSREIRTIDQRVYGQDNPATAVATYTLAELLALQGRRNEAFPLIRESLDHGLPAGIASGIAGDDNLESLRDDPGFAVLVADGKQRATAQKTANSR
jgi:eukaryotic-like serine/threonine-protein kinase